MDSPPYDLIVVGAGIVGLTTNSDRGPIRALSTTDLRLPDADLPPDDAVKGYQASQCDDGQPTRNRRYRRGRKVFHRRSPLSHGRFEAGTFGIRP